MRDIKVTKDFINSENTSVLYESGNTKVLITVSIADKVPRWLENSDKGWLTAEYNMLPGSSDQRISRKSFEGGRSKEISRLIGRSLRSVCLEIQGTAEQKPFSKEDLDKLFEMTKDEVNKVFDVQKNV